MLDWEKYRACPAILSPPPSHRHRHTQAPAEERLHTSCACIHVEIGPPPGPLRPLPTHVHALGGDGLGLTRVVPRGCTCLGAHEILHGGTTVHRGRGGGTHYAGIAAMEIQTMHCRMQYSVQQEVTERPRGHRQNPAHTSCPPPLVLPTPPLPVRLPVVPPFRHRPCRPST